jgi:hypothetical protein
MPRGQGPRGGDERAFAYIDKVNVGLELTYLRSGSDPDWERPHINGVDVTGSPELWSPYQRARREAFVERVEAYRADGLL